MWWIRFSTHFFAISHFQLNQDDSLFRVSYVVFFCCCLYANEHAAEMYVQTYAYVTVRQRPMAHLQSAKSEPTYTRTLLRTCVGLPSNPAHQPSHQANGRLIGWSVVFVVQTPPSPLLVPLGMKEVGDNGVTWRSCIYGVRWYSLSLSVGNI